jgi:hypothetical protein
MRKNKILNIRGFVLPSVLAVSAVVTAMAGHIFLRSLNVSSRLIKETELWKLEYTSEKAISLAGYLISNGFVLCREKGWTGHPENQKCKWGTRTENDVEITPSRYGLSAASYKGDGSMVMQLEPQKNLGERMPVEIVFQLKNIELQPELVKLLGFIPNEVSPSDNDIFAVIITASTEYFVGQNVQLGMEMKKFQRQAAIRRPLGTPFLNITESPTCLYSCVTGMSDTINPQCRGPREIGAASTAGMSMQVKNLGPGPIYDLIYERTLSFNQLMYPGEPDRKKNFSGLAPGQDVLMPGESVTRTDSVECIQPVTVYLPSNESQVVTVNTPNGPIQISRDTLTQTFQRLFSYRYDVMVSRYNYPQYASNLTQFFQAYNPFDSSTYAPNTTNSKIEPNKSSGFISSVMTTGTSVRLESPPCDPSLSCCTGAEASCGGDQTPPSGNGDGGGGC